jgi:hypothetical protein
MVIVWLLDDGFRSCSPLAHFFGAHRIGRLTIISEGNTAVFASLNLGQGCLPVLLPSGTLRWKIKRGLLENPAFIDDDLHDESHCYVWFAEGEHGQRKTACLMRIKKSQWNLAGIVPYQDDKRIYPTVWSVLLPEATIVFMFNLNQWSRGFSTFSFYSF